MGNCIDCSTALINKERIHTALTQTLNSTDNLNTEDIYYVVSDLHLGDGSDKDNSVKNMSMILNFMDAVIDEGAKLILLGDIEDLWSFEEADILKAHGDFYLKYNLLRANGKLIRINGNHDNGTSAYNALILKHNENKIMLVHGHQGSFDKNSPITGCAECCVSALSSLKDVESNITLHGLMDNVYSEWAFKNKVFLICGHTHYPLFDSSNLCYMNDGSLIEPSKIQYIRITRDTAQLKSLVSKVGGQEFQTPLIITLGGVNFDQAFAYMNSGSKYKPIHLDVNTS